MLTIYRRHSNTCKHRGKGRSHLHCGCPLWADGLGINGDGRQSLGTRDWQQAQEAVRKLESQASPNKRDEPMTITAGCEKILADAMKRNLRPDTIAKYKLLKRELEAFAGARKITTFAAFDLDALTDFRASWKNSNHGALKKLERLRCFFRFAHDGGWIAENLAKRIKNPQVRTRPTLPYSQAQMSKILRAAHDRVNFVQSSGKDNARRLPGLVLLLRYSGLRIGDAVSCSIDRLVDGKLRLYTAKTGQHVHCPLPEFVVAELDRMPRRSDRYWFWSGEGDVHSLVTKWEELLRKVFVAAGVPDGHAHRLRDTFATDLLLAGVPIERVAVMLGHSSQKITEKHYSPWVRERQEQAEADVRRSWARDPLALMETSALAAKVTQETAQVQTSDSGKREAIN